MSDVHPQRRGNEEGLHLWLRVAKICAIVAVACTVGVVLIWYGVRTPVVLDRVVGPQLAERAERSDIELRVGAFGAAGLTGIRLYEVDMVSAGDDSTTRLTADTVDVVPAIGRSLSQRQPVVRSVEVGRADLVVEPGRRDRSEQPGEQEVAAEPGEPEMAADPADPLLSWLDEEVELQVDRLTAASADFGQRGEFRDLEAVVDPEAGRLHDLEAAGELAGIDVQLAGNDESLYLDVSNTPLREVLQPLPADIELERISVDQQVFAGFFDGEGLQEVSPTLHGLTIRPHSHDSAVFETEEARLDARSGSLRWSAPQMTVTTSRGSHLLDEPTAEVFAGEAVVDFSVGLVDQQSGTIRLEGRWRPGSSLVELDARAQQFRWNGPEGGLVPDGVPVESLQLDGQLDIQVDLAHQLVVFDGELTLRQLILDSPLLASQPVSFDEIELQLPVAADLGSRAVSIAGATVALEEVEPLRVDARVVAAGANAHAFELDAAADDVDAAGLVQALPDPLVGPVSDARLEGRFDVATRVGGHTGYPDELSVDVDLIGDVEVLEDVPWGDGAIEQGDAVVLEPYDDGGLRTEGDWTDTDELPDHVAATVLAAEDARFFDHEGIDWGGIEAAMAENLRRRAPVRGGSTITQQVAKNLFLSHERTLARKLQEAYLGWRLEQRLSKHEILEVYLNIAEWGPGVYGVDQAAQHFFERPAHRLEPLEIAMLAAILPNPHRFGGAIEEGYLPSSREDKIRRVLENLRFVERLDWHEYNTAVDQLDDSQLGAREFESCADDETAGEDAPPCDNIEIQGRDGEDTTFRGAETADSSEPGQWSPVVR